MSTSNLLLRRLLDAAGGAEESGYFLVLDGEGLEDLPDEIPTAKGKHHVHRVSTELGLRHLLWKARGAPLIAVLPEVLAQKIQKAPDLLRRARNQRIHALSVNDVLEVVLGVRVIGAESPHLQALALEKLEQLGRALSQRTLPTVVDRKLLTELLVDSCVGERMQTQTPAELLAAWVQDPPEWSEDVSKLIRETLPSMHGDAGRLLSWALEKPDENLRALVVHGAILTVDGEVPKDVWGPLWSAATREPVETDRRVVRRVASRLAEETIIVLGDGAISLLEEADRLGRSKLTPTQLSTSRVLPLAFVDRCHTLAQRAAEGKPIGAVEIAWLSTHRVAHLHRAELEVLTCLARLSRYLDSPMGSAAHVEDHVRRYQAEGAFADLAALHLRRALAASGRFHKESGQVLSKVRERRDGENRAFAEVLAAGYEAALHRKGLTPLHRVWKREVAQRWQNDPTTRIYLVVLDGCSFPLFIEILASLAQDSSFPMGIRPNSDGRVVTEPALSPLPTVTSHARGALFLGELPQDPLVPETVFRDLEEPKTDKARFKQNTHLGGRHRRLFLKADLADGGGQLLGALADSDLAVVAAVFNAVDDQIGSSNTGASVKLKPEDISAFKPSLREALRHGRQVLIVADHGHSPFVDKGLRAGAGKTSRYINLEPHAPVPDGFIEIDLGSLGGPPERRAFAWRPGVYLGNPQVGFHGGCGLEEMVVPLAWLQKEGLHLDEPTWWFGEGFLPEPIPAVRFIEPPLVTPVPTEPKRPKQKALPQLAFDAAERASALPLTPELRERLDEDQRRILVILMENGTAKTSELAALVRKNPARLNGLMRTLRRVLHAEGVPLFSDEVLPSGETQYHYDPPEGAR